MISKCNTAEYKSSLTPINAIYTTEFIDNQEDLFTRNSNEEILVNIATIRQCKKQTEELVDHMHHQLSQQYLRVGTLQELQNKQKEKSKLYVHKYHDAMLQLRKKDQLLENMERKYQILEEKYQFLKDSESKEINRLLVQEQSFKQKIHHLESQLEQLQTLLWPSHPESKYLETTVVTIENFKNNQDSTFV